MFARIVFNFSLDHSFFYSIPAHLENQVAVGKRVVAPLNGTLKIGLIVSTQDVLEKSYEIKPIESILDENPLCRENDIKLYSWLASYYKYPFPRVIWHSLPNKIAKRLTKKVKLTEKTRDDNLLKKQHRIILNAFSSKKILSEKTIEKKTKIDKLFPYLQELESMGFIETIFQAPFIESSLDGNPLLDHTYPFSNIPRLNSHQERAYAELQRGIDTHSFSPFLLHGVTGSGKTEVYLRSIEYLLKHNSKARAIMLVPEIALTPQLIEIVTGRFGPQVAVFHSKMTEDEKCERWVKILLGTMRVMIGVRSLVLLPIPEVQLIVVDEEHETTYKQDSLLLYNARDTALMKGKIFGCTVILGSATPSIESYFNAHLGKYVLLHLPERVTQALPPKAEIIDMKDEDKAFGETPIISEKLEDEIRKNLDTGEKTILFLNRRGFSSLILCNKCGSIKTCKFCSVSLSYHQGINTLLCHYCGYTEEFTDKCYHCGKHAVTKIGLGTERIHHELEQKFPDAKLFRMDSDTTKKKGTTERFHELFKKGEIDILIGTQMIAKGLDFPEVTLVGIIYADLTLTIPDFRACERTFQLITQVAGRAGRGEQKGRVIIQTFNPTQYSIIKAQTHDYVAFYEQELTYRKELDYPPYSRLANIRISGVNERYTKTAAYQAAHALSTIRDTNPHFAEKIILLGPAMCPIYKINDKYRWSILIKGKNAQSLDLYLDKYLENQKDKPPQVSLKIDIDPLNFL